MTIVASSSLTISNVNDGTITHTAYAYSADGTNGFTTVYPNLNLLNFNSGVTFGKYYGWGADVTSYSGNRAYFKKVKVTPNNKYTISANWSIATWLNVYGFTNEIDTIAVARYGSVSGQGTGSWDSNFVGGYTVANNMTFTVPANVNYIGVSYASISTDTLTLQALLNGKPKVEFGSTATPYMPSSSEVTTADWPSYIGQYTDFTQDDNTNPFAYTWSLIRGNDGRDGANGKDGIAGKDGVGIKTTTITYAISTSGTTAPTSGWTSSVPSLVKGQYLWTKTVWTYTDNSSETGYSVTYISKDGNNGNDGIAGKDGTGIKTTTITYAGSTSGTTAPTSGWTTTVPTVAAGSYLWTKTVWAYTDNTSETGYSVAKMGNDGATGPQGPQGNTGPQGPTGPSGVDGNPGKIVSDTEPTSKFKGLTWKYSGIVDMTLGDGTTILAGTEYYWNGTVWALYEINAHNINGDNLSVTNGTFKDGKIQSVWVSGGVNGTTTIEKNHLQIYSNDSTINTENTVALDNQQGYAQVYTDHKTGRTITVQASFQGFFISDSTGPYAKVTPTGVVTSVDVPWTSIGTYADYKRDGNVVTIRVVDAITTTAGNITLGRIPSKDGPVEAVMGPAIAWSSDNTNDKHLQINAASGGAIVTILNAAANQKYKFQFSYQI